jgi:hypothetical protein
MNESQNPQASVENQDANVPVSSNTGETSQSNTTVNSNLPDNLRGKSTEELASMYQSLEKKLGEQSNELGSARKLKQDMEVVLQAINSDPELYKTIEAKLSGKQDTNSVSDNGKKDNGEDKQTQVPSDVRIAEQNRTINEFEGKYKLNELPSEKRQEINKRIALELADMVDPGGKKSIAQVIQGIPAHKLSSYLDKAYVLANIGPLMTSGSSNFDISSISSMAAASAKTENKNSLSPTEIKIAESLGMSVDDYAKNKRK